MKKLTIAVPEDLSSDFTAACERRGLTVTDAVLKMMRQVVRYDAGGVRVTLVDTATGEKL